MRNRALALAARPIPYIKELREIAGSVTAAILMQQLDHWFHSYPDGFYKFLAPCDNAACKEGETWTEELGFSKEEFRAAFDKIGIRHESKRAFESVENPFLVAPAVEPEEQRERFYASYHDKIRGLTFYFRNHDLVDAKLDELLARKPKKATPFRSSKDAPVSRETQSPEIGKPNLRKSGNPISVSGESLLTEIGKPNLEYKETKKTTEKTTKKEEEETPFASPLLTNKQAEIVQSIAAVMGYSGVPDGKFGQQVSGIAREFEDAGVTPNDVQAFEQDWYRRKMAQGKAHYTLTLPILSQDLPGWVRARRIQSSNTNTNSDIESLPAWKRKVLGL